MIGRWIPNSRGARSSVHGDYGSPHLVESLMARPPACDCDEALLLGLETEVWSWASFVAVALSQTCHRLQLTWQELRTLPLSRCTSRLACMQRVRYSATESPACAKSCKGCEMAATAEYCFCACDTGPAYAPHPFRERHVRYPFRSWVAPTLYAVLAIQDTSQLCWQHTATAPVYRNQGRLFRPSSFPHSPHASPPRSRRAWTLQSPFRCSDTSSPLTPSHHRPAGGSHRGPLGRHGPPPRQHHRPLSSAG